MAYRYSRPSPLVRTARGAGPEPRGKGLTQQDTADDRSVDGHPKLIGSRNRTRVSGLVPSRWSVVQHPTSRGQAHEGSGVLRDGWTRGVPIRGRPGPRLRRDQRPDHERGRARRISEVRLRRLRQQIGECPEARLLARLGEHLLDVAPLLGFACLARSTIERPMRRFTRSSSTTVSRRSSLPGRSPSSSAGRRGRASR